MEGTEHETNFDKMFTFLWDDHFSQFVLVIHICRSKEGISGSSLVSLNVRSDSLVKQMFKYLVSPFTVSEPTSPEDLKLIQYVFDSSLNGRSEFFVRVLVCLAERF
jgi:hypothetical protein